MRTRRLNEDEIETLRALRSGGASYQSLADIQGCGKKTVYDALNGRRPPRPANDNFADRVTRFSPHNGGCSTTSGMVPVTLARVPSIDGDYRGVAA
ncbi:helix-turn-helix domain-containing protein [Agrobacterium sp. MS2]|uniref:helix-turn-helix domain-containing protein n=1 Tax=Agrobacterium sp. MS2 TaxID=1345498 RepID=UPI000DBFE8A2|nr:helix-turn-helix domain-containing protein [Agrobacterium sp. MS2]RAL98696.1 hypothetical protein DOU54_06455 [Agrobacterium sp. MS2]